MSAFILKVLVCIAMLGDHLAAVFPSVFPFEYRIIGRISFPIFAFFVAEGCSKTRNCYKYMARLAIFALISEIPFDLVFNQVGYIEGVAINWLEGTNVLYTLFFGSAAITVIREAAKKRRPYLLLLPVILIIPAITFVPEFELRGKPLLFGSGFTGTELWWVPALAAKLLFLLMTALELLLCKLLPERPAEQKTASLPDKQTVSSRLNEIINLSVSIIPAFAICCAAGALKTDYGLLGAAWVLVYYLANPGARASRCLACLSGVLFVYGQSVIQTYFDTITDKWLTVIDQWSLYLFLGALCAIPLLALYNGNRGKPAKWGFYAYYPAHLSVIAIIVYTMIIAG